MSSRDQTFRKKVVVSAIALFLIIILILFRESAFLYGIRSFSVSLSQPLMRGALWVRNSFGFWIPVFRGEEARMLLEENQRLKASAARLEFLVKENELLHTTLGLKENTGVAPQIATVRLFSTQRGREFLIIDRGRESGIKEGDVVFEGHKMVVGIVQEAGSGFSKVTIAANAGSAFEVTLVPLEARALAKGLGARAFSVEFVPVGTPLSKGDFIMFSLQGSEEPLLLAEVVEAKSGSSVAFQNVRAVMLARPELLSTVLVWSGVQK